MKMISTKYRNEVVGIFTKDMLYTSNEVWIKADEFTKCKFAQIGGQTKVVPQHGNIIHGFPVFTDETGKDYVFITDTVWRYQYIRDVLLDPGYKIAEANLIETVENGIRLCQDAGTGIKRWDSIEEGCTGKYEPTIVYYGKATVKYFSSTEEYMIERSRA